MTARGLAGSPADGGRKGALGLSTLRREQKMKNSKQLLLAAALAAALASHSFAQQAQGSQPAAVAAAASEMADAEVRKVDKDQKKITLRHGEIKSLDMPPMTMVFGVRDAALLDKLKAGDKVRFKAIDEGGGKLAVIEIQSAK